MRIGHGYDVHRLIDKALFESLYPSRQAVLTLGGVKITHHKLLQGHSDADVVVHALIDALLGAAGLDDIGTQFPDNDDSYAGISSLILLEKTLILLECSQLRIGNCDITIIAQAPKLRPYIDEMKTLLATNLKISTNQINIKATTEEGLGFTGEEQGIAAHAVCILLAS